VEYQQQKRSDRKARPQEWNGIGPPPQCKLGEDRYRSEGNGAHRRQRQSNEVGAVGVPVPGGRFYGVGVAAEPVECAQTWNP
jgi:hypothetical protein